MIKNNIIKWARERSSLSIESAAKKLSIKQEVWEDWEKGVTQPTFKKIEKIAQKFYVPLGYLFLDTPPIEQLPIPDFRTINNEELKKPSPELLDVVYDAQRKQTWLTEIRAQEEQPQVLNIENYKNDEQIITTIRDDLGINFLQKEAKNHGIFLRNIIESLDEQGFMVIRNGIVGNNTHRPLKTDEFRGFALYDKYAPLIFINGKDAKAGQIFTIIHELAHLLLGESGLDGSFNKNTEQRCNKIAAEVLVPSHQLKEIYQRGNEEDIAKQFKVSSFVILIKAKQLGLITQDYLDERWQYFKDKILKISNVDFKKFSTQIFESRAGGKQFLHTVINYTLAGKTLYRDAYKLTGLNGRIFTEYCEKIKKMS